MPRSGIYIVPPYQDRPSARLTRRSVVQPATRFHPQDRNLSPEVHFPLQTVFAPDRPPYPRFINRFDSREMLLVVDGSCINNGRHASADRDPVAGCSFLFKATPSLALDRPASPVTFPFLATQKLEREGPDGVVSEHTSNRAKLRAVIAALQFRPWDAEGWRRVVILTDLEYIVNGATLWLPKWVKRRWRKPRAGGGGKYLNRDLWEELQARIDELRARGCEVSFWLVKRDDERESEFIELAKKAAQRAARAEPGVQVEKFTKLCGIML
ncbi:ribonuclease H [Echria macrotheca]|uniref:Ribonuclease H n=1 Tax=Echria macrotheca TaxID=438768 RepID=A0AAJ0B974_9PEZI|nr:ribonuclease H [Echria macrotheca]